jgi:NADP-reducing hydrogenase subunit HndD
MEYFYPDIIPHISTCKSPHEMGGAIIKSYFAETHGLDPKDIFVVSIMPCTAKKYEKTRPQNAAVQNLPDVDAVLTTRELAKIIKRAGINWQKLPEEQFDDDLIGEYSGAGVIFGVTGGVMEAALRTAYHELTGKEADIVAFSEVRGLENIKEAELDINGTKVRVAVSHGMKNAKPLLDQIRNGTSPYHFIEIMGCPGGCINGGGQPFVKPVFLPNEDDNILETYMKKRASVLYSEDEKQVVRQSHNNKDILRLYKNYLGEPCGHKAHHLLHTSYVADRVRFPGK